MVATKKELTTPSREPLPDAPVIRAISQPVLKDQSINVPTKTASTGDMKNKMQAAAVPPKAKPTTADMKNTVIAAFKERSVNVATIPEKQSVSQEAGPYAEVSGSAAAAILHTMHATNMDARRVLPA
uniref:Uncharacterized protein n=1 Tax=Eutreptiella gymnastica TaxID=73025 RepID=A0A7S1J8Z5_9EUGL